MKKEEKHKQTWDQETMICLRSSPNVGYISGPCSIVGSPSFIKWHQINQVQETLHKWSLYLQYGIWPKNGEPSCWNWHHHCILGEKQCKNDNKFVKFWQSHSWPSRESLEDPSDTPAQVSGPLGRSWFYSAWFLLSVLLLVRWFLPCRMRKNKFK